MALIKVKYRDRHGVIHEAPKWYIVFCDPLGKRRRLVGFTNKKATENLERCLQELVLCKQTRQMLPADLHRWLDDIPSTLRNKLLEWRLIDSAHIAAGKTLPEHIEDWHGYLLAKGDTEDHANKSRSRVKKIVDSCHFTVYADISAAEAASYLHRLNIGKSTRNHYLTAFKGFCTWMCRDGRASLNPVAYLHKINAQDDVKRERRVLTIAEIEYLLVVTESEPKRHGLTGTERSLLYQLALSTGLRASELASLTRESFNLATEPPEVTVEAAYSKRKRPDTLPLPDALVALLRPVLDSLRRGQKLFSLHKYPRTAEMLADDLEAARKKWIAEAEDDTERKLREESDMLLYMDSSGRYADFHSTRHSFGTYLAASGVHPKVAQSLMRHSDINLTMSRYSHVLAGQESEAISKLPWCRNTKDVDQETTGTEG